MTFVIKFFQKTQESRSINEFTMMKNLMNVNIATKDLQIKVNWFHTKAYIEEKNHILVKFVKKVLLGVQIYRSTA